MTQTMGPKKFGGGSRHKKARNTAGLITGVRQMPVTKRLAYGRAAELPI